MTTSQHIPPTQPRGRILPMLLQDGRSCALVDPACVYEPKYDGIRGLLTIGATLATTRLLSRDGADKSEAFPEIVRAAWRLGTADSPAFPGGAVLDGEVVALRADGTLDRLPALRGRIHRTPRPGDPRVAFVAWDLLQAGAADLRGLPLLGRRFGLALALGMVGRDREVIRLADQVVGDGRALWAAAVAEGREGLVRKRADSVYQSGARSADWLKRKVALATEAS